MFVRHEINPRELIPSFPSDRLFKGAHPVPDTPVNISLSEGDRTVEGTRTVEVQTLCQGPSSGSADGPTLMHLGAIARLSYQGLIAPAGQAT